MAQNKKIEEKDYIDKFLNTELGKNWYQKYNFKDYTEAESPDFIFITQDNRKLGLEVTEFIANNEQGNALRALKRIGNKICKQIQDKHKLQVSMVIDKYDKRKWEARTREEFLESVYNPGFTDHFDEEEIKSKIYPLIDKNIEKLKTFPCLVQEWIEVNNEQLKFSISEFPNTDGSFGCHVNNQSFSKQDPFKELQEEIDKKNKKFDNYLKNCDECFLLVCNPDVSMGNYCHFTDELNMQRFSYKFSNVFLYDEFNKTAISLKKK